MKLIGAASRFDFEKAFTESNPNWRTGHGYDTRTYLFDRWPDEFTWHRVEITFDEFANDVFHIRGRCGWEAVPHPIDSARLAGGGSPDDPAPKIRAIANSLDFGDRPVARTIILVAPEENSEVVILEGNHRAGALVLTETDISAFRFLIGVSLGITNWRWYRD